MVLKRRGDGRVRRDIVAEEVRRRTRRRRTKVLDRRRELCLAKQLRASEDLGSDRRMRFERIVRNNGRLGLPLLLLYPRYRRRRVLHLWRSNVVVVGLGQVVLRELREEMWNQAKVDCTRLVRIQSPILPGAVRRALLQHRSQRRG